MKQIEIMRPDASIVFDGARHEITGRSAEVFRLLVLSEGAPVSMSDIAQIRDTNIDAVRGKVRDLRRQIARCGCEDLVRSDHGIGYHVCLEDYWVDAHEFRRTIEPLKGGFGMDAKLYKSPKEALSNAETLSHILGLWKYNPAGNLPTEFAFGPLFDTLKARAEDRLLMARLYSRQYDQIREAIQHLEHRCRSRGGADDALWQLLLLAYHAIGNIGQISLAWENMVKSDKARSGRLSRFMASLNAGEFSNPFLINQGQQKSVDSQEIQHSESDNNSLTVLCKVLGITTASQLRLIDSHLTPKACISRARHRLHFSGVLASKWVIEPAIRSQFDQMLTRFDGDGGQAKFLMINPKSESFKQLRELRQGNISLESLQPLLELSSRHESLEVRAYDGLPSFRIVVIDEDVVSFSPYRLAADAYLTTDRGWEAPHVVLDPVAKYPLAEAFKLLFEERWRTSVPIEEIA